MTVNDYFSADAPKEYLVAAGAQLRATVTFHAREKDDGYQYIAIYANTSTSYVDTGAKDGDPGTVSYSRYMAGFTIDGNVSSTWYPYTFPLTSKGDSCGEQTHPWSGNSNGNLKQQYFKSNCRAADGRLIIPTNLSSLYSRLNASGNLNDTWYASNVVADVQAVDNAVPARLATAVAPGIRARGNEFYVSVAFSEPVTCSSATLTNSWGSLTYNSGSGSNVLTFKGMISANVNETIQNLVLEGIFEGVGTVISFLPIIAILFLFLSLLEDSGYIARVAFVMDKLLRRIGLSGRSIVPMLIGFGCTVPAVMSTRTLPSDRDRRMTILLTPFMSCPAKMPI